LTQKQVEKDVEVLDLRGMTVKPLHCPKLHERLRDKHGRFQSPKRLPVRTLISVGFRLTVVPAFAIVALHVHPLIAPGSTSTTSTTGLSGSNSNNNGSNSSTGNTGNAGNSLTFLHGTAQSSSFVPSTIEFEGLVTLYVPVSNGQYHTDLPQGQYGVQMWQGTGDSRPECNVYNGILNPFTVNNVSDQVANFTC
jgi:hypothetical protein